MYKYENFYDFAFKIDELGYNKSILLGKYTNKDEIANAEGCDWYSVTKISFAESEAIYINLVGGGSPHIIDITIDDYDQRRDKLQEVLQDELGIDTYYDILVDYNDESPLTYGSREFADRMSDALYMTAKKHDCPISNNYPTSTEWQKAFPDETSKKYVCNEHDMSAIFGEIALANNFSDTKIKEATGYFYTEMELRNCDTDECIDRFKGFINRGVERAKITTDFKNAIESCADKEPQRRSDLKDIARTLNYMLSKNDISNLAICHRDGDKKTKDKIEYLLEDMNFHEETSAFANGDYAKYVKQENKIKTSNKKTDVNIE